MTYITLFGAIYLVFAAVGGLIGDMSPEVTLEFLAIANVWFAASAIVGEMRAKP